MTAPRLPSLWPLMTRSFESLSPSVRCVRADARSRAFHSPPPRRRPNTALQQRYGTANEPPPHLGGGKGLPPPTKQSAAEAPKALPKIGETLQKDGEAEVTADQPKKDKLRKDSEAKKEPAQIDANATQCLQVEPMLDADDSQPTRAAPGSPELPPERPLESLLDNVPDPSEHSEEHQQQSTAKKAPVEEVPGASLDEHSPPVKAPHISTPRYVHHFDTYGLVRKLVEAGWSDAQAITIMKGVRVVLAENMDIAREALVSKSQVENETYLFRAACAELKTEVTARRKSEQEKMRTQRNQLQHEVEILSQKLGQESGVMKDELKGMFDDRTMAVRNEQRAMESKIQRLNYQITVDLQADAKSEVEGLRWVMTRRVIIALATVIIMVIGSLKLYSNAVHEQDLEAKRRANMKSGGTQTDNFHGGNGSGGDFAETHARQISPGEMVVKEGDNPGYVSLG